VARVLVLEPSEEIRELLGRALARLGHEPVFDGEVDHSEVDAIIFEPAFARGFAVARAVRERRPDVPLICVTVEDRSAAPPLSPAAYLQKPFHLAHFEHAVDAALAVRA
jgi:DNA-binding response OmpR family regulator